MTNNNKPQQEPEITVNPSSAAVTPPTAPDKQDSPAPNQPSGQENLGQHTSSRQAATTKLAREKVGERGAFAGISARRRFCLCASAAKK